MSTIVLFLSLEAIDIAYTDTVDPQTHVLLEEKSPNLYTVVREGVKIRDFLMQMLKLKEDEMAEEQFSQLASPVLVCLSGKSRSYAQGIFEKLSPQLQRHLIYYKIDKNAYKDYPFNRAILEGNEICYGEGFSQLRTKEEMRIAFFSLLGDRMKECIFVEKNSVELKDLKKEGYEYLLDDFNAEKLNQMIHKIRAKADLRPEEVPVSEGEIVGKFDFANQYLNKFIEQYKAITLKHINPFNTSLLGIKGLISQLHRPSPSYNLSPKSWVPHSSKQISAYVFHNISDQRLYVARAAKPKDFSNEQDYEVKIFAQYLSHIIDPQSYTMPHDRHSFLMKFSKIKAYENKKAIMNIRPYVEKVVTISELGLPAEEIVKIFRDGRLWGQKVNGIAGMLLISWLINDSLKAKSLSQQLSFLSISKMDGQILFVSSSNLKQSEELFVCRTDFHNIFNMSNFKQANPQLIICNNPPVKLAVHQLHPQVLAELVELIYNIRDQRLAFIRSLVLYYGWQTKLVHLYEVITYRLELIRSMLREEQVVNVRGQLLRNCPQLASLLIEEDYNYFMLPSPTIYSPVDYTSGASYEPGKIHQNPYLAYLGKVCSFGIFNLHFPVLTYLQWLKSTSKYQIIQYISMLNNTLEGYKIMDLRLKQQVINEKKTAILIVDHVQLCEELVEKAKSIKTVLIFRLRKTVQIQNFGIITQETKKEDDLSSSSDELIKVLWRQGLKQFGKDNKFELIDWILTSYIKIKCQMYDFPLNEVLAFLPVLHRAISTNKHRIKQIKEIYPNQYKFLYAFPIVKQSQKVQFAHRLFEFLHVKYLFANVLSGQWGNRLQTYQNNSLLFCRKLVDAGLAVRIVQRLLEDLRCLQAKKTEMFDYQYQCGEILQLVRSLTETSRAEEEQNQPYCLYFQVFPKILKIFNFQMLKRVVQVDNFLVAQDLQAIYFYVDSANQPIKVLQKRNNQQILGLQLGEDRILRVLSWFNNSAFVECYLLGSEDELEESKSHPTCSLVSTVEVKHSIIEQYLVSGQQTNADIQIGWLQNCHCIILPSQLQIIVLLVSPQTGETFIRITELSSPLLKLSLHRSQGELLCITQQSILLIPISPDSSNDRISTLPLHRPFSLNVKLHVEWCAASDVRVWVSEGTMLQCVSLSRRGELITHSKFEFPSPLKALTVSNQLLLVFPEGCDNLEIYQLETVFSETALCKYRQYYSVQANCADILVGRTSIYLRGGHHYLKKIQLPLLTSPSQPLHPALIV